MNPLPNILRKVLKPSESVSRILYTIKTTNIRTGGLEPDHCCVCLYAGVIEFVFWGFGLCHYCTQTYDTLSTNIYDNSYLTKGNMKKVLHKHKEQLPIEQDVARRNIAICSLLRLYGVTKISVCVVCMCMSSRVRAGFNLCETCYQDVNVVISTILTKNMLSCKVIQDTLSTYNLLDLVSVVCGYYLCAVARDIIAEACSK